MITMWNQNILERDYDKQIIYIIIQNKHVVIKLIHFNAIAHFYTEL